MYCFSKLLRVRCKKEVAPPCFFANIILLETKIIYTVPILGP